MVPLVRGHTRSLARSACRFEPSVDESVPISAGDTSRKNEPAARLTSSLFSDPNMMDTRFDC